MTHAKGLAGQHTAQHHTFKQVCLGKVRQQDGGGFLPGAGGKRHGRGGAVDVIHAGLGVAVQEVVQKGFNTAHRQGSRGILQGHQQLTVLVGNGKALLRRGGLVALGLVPLIDGLVQLMGRYTEHHTVDRLDLDGRAMYIADLGQAPAGGVILLLFGGQAVPLFLVHQQESLFFHHQRYNEHYQCVHGSGQL